jgi:hypothetical protein
MSDVIWSVICGHLTLSIPLLIPLFVKSDHSLTFLIRPGIFFERGMNRLQETVIDD